MESPHVPSPSGSPPHENLSSADAQGTASSNQTVSVDHIPSKCGHVN